MSSLRLSLALFATVVASVLADFGPHEGYGSHEGGFGGRGFGGDHGAKFGFGHDVGHKESYGKGEKKDWAEFKMDTVASMENMEDTDMDSKDMEAMELPKPKDTVMATDLELLITVLRNTEKLSSMATDPFNSITFAQL